MIGRMCRRWHGGATKLKCIATIPPAEVNDVSESTNSKMERRTSDEQPSLWPAVELDFTISRPHRVLVMSEQCVHHSSVSLLSPQHFSRIP